MGCQHDRRHRLLTTEVLCDRHDGEDTRQGVKEAADSSSGSIRTGFDDGVTPLSSVLYNSVHAIMNGDVLQVREMGTTATGCGY
jgi:hypothetical protein